jgi:hypothetical protein
MITLLVKANDVIQLTGIGGNVDTDQLNPSINIAQSTHIKRILGLDLYNKILTDYKNDDLAGNYLTIYNDYISFMLSFFSVSIYLSLNNAKISNAGTFKMNIENGTQPTPSEINTLGKNHESIAISYETNFYEFMKTIDIPEYNKSEVKETTNLIQWY